MSDFYSKLFYIITGLAVLAVLYTQFGELFTSLSENFGWDIYWIYLFAIVIVFGVIRFVGGILKTIFISDKPKKKSKREIKKEEKDHENFRRLQAKNNFQESKLAWTHYGIFHAVISLFITILIYAFLGELITELSELTDRPTMLFYLGISLGLFALIRFLLKPIIWLFAGNKDKWV